MEFYKLYFTKKKKKLLNSYPLFSFWARFQVLNQIVIELPEEHPLSDTRPLRELLGHTPLQVCSGTFKFHVETDLLLQSHITFVCSMLTYAHCTWHVSHACKEKMQILPESISPYHFRCLLDWFMYWSVYLELMHLLRVIDKEFFNWLSACLGRLKQDVLFLL